MYIGVMTEARLKQRQTLRLRRKTGWAIEIPVIKCYTCPNPILVGETYVTTNSAIRHLACAIKVGLLSQEEAPLL